VKLVMLAIIFLLVPLTASAEVEVAFIEMRTPDGKTLQLERGGRFAHIAISYRGKWLHAHPFYGVEIVESEKLERIGVIKEVWTVSGLTSLDREEVARFIGKPFDSSYSWSDEKIYCSELVGKCSGITHSDRHSYIISTSTRALDRNDWTYANQGWNYARSDLEKPSNRAEFNGDAAPLDTPSEQKSSWTLIGGRPGSCMSLGPTGILVGAQASLVDCTNPCTEPRSIYQRSSSFRSTDRHTPKEPQSRWYRPA